MRNLRISYKHIIFIVIYVVFSECGGNSMIIINLCSCYLINYYVLNLPEAVFYYKYLT